MATFVPQLFADWLIRMFLVYRIIMLADWSCACSHLNTVFARMISRTGVLLMQAAISSGSEVIAIITESDSGLNDPIAFDGSPCGQTLATAQYILDRWAHSVPHVKPAQVLQLQPPSQVYSK